MTFGTGGLLVVIVLAPGFCNPSPFLGTSKSSTWANKLTMSSCPTQNGDQLPQLNRAPRAHG